MRTELRPPLCLARRVSTLALLASTALALTSFASPATPQGHSTGGISVPGVPPISGGSGGGHGPPVSSAGGGVHLVPSPDAPGDNGPAQPTPGPIPKPGPTGATTGKAMPASLGPGSGQATTGQNASTVGTQAQTTFDLGPDLSTWQIWWGYNQDRFLPVKQAIFREEPTTGGTEFYAGLTGGASSAVQSRYRPTAYDLRERAVPLLLAILKEDPTPELAAAALLALGRIGEDPSASGSRTLQDAITAYLSHSNSTVSEVATIALGSLASPWATPVLAAVLGDTTEGRKLCGHDSVSERQRAFAAYGLGLTGHHTKRAEVRTYAVHYLASTLEGEDSATHDVEVACAVSLGLILVDDVGGNLETAAQLPPSASRAALVSRLLAFFEDEHENRLLRAHLPVSLAHLVAGKDSELKELVGKRLVQGLGKRTAEKKREVRQGCVIALGMLGDADEDALDVSIREALMRLAKDGDEQEKRYAAIALADVGSRPGQGNGSPLAGSVEVRRFLIKQLGKGVSNVRPWYGLALGMLGGRLLEHGKPFRAEEVGELRKSLVDCRSADYVGAYALGAALLSDHMSSEALLEKLDEFQGDDVRGHTALALGILGSDRAVEPLRELLRESLHHPEVLRQTSVALALLGDKTLVAELTAQLKECDCTTSSAAVATALGFSGDRTAIEPLIALLAPEHTSNVRASAAMALGRVADKDDYPWSSELSINLHYIAGPTSLAEPNGFGVADLR